MFEPLLAWLKASRDWQLRGRLDLTRLVAAGHSRGGKLAALMFAGGWARTGVQKKKNGCWQAAYQPWLGNSQKHVTVPNLIIPAAWGRPLFAEAKLGCRAAYLVDPVDLFDPSGVNALKRAGRPVGITGCGVWGPFNPPLVNYQARDASIVLGAGCCFRLTEAGINTRVTPHAGPFAGIAIFSLGKPLLLSGLSCRRHSLMLQRQAAGWCDCHV